MTRLAPLPLAGMACRHTRLSVPGMRCAGCIAKVEQGLSAAPGVISARVDFSAKQVLVAHLPEIEVPVLVAALDRIGFAAHPLVVTRGADPGQRALLAALGVAGFAAMNIMLLSVAVWSGAGGANRDLFHWLSAIIAIPAIAFAGRPFFTSAWSALRHGRTNMDVPISIGVLLATALSLYETISHGPHAWFDGSVMLLFFLLAGRVLDSAMRDRARRGAAALMQASAPGALRLSDDGSTRWCDAADLAQGDCILVPAGQRLAADGVIAAGTSRIDAAILTGESAPRGAAPGDDVLAGMLNLDAPLTIRVTSAGEDRSIAALARAMADAGQARSRYVRIADRASRIYAPAVHTLAAVALVGWLVAGAGIHQSLVVAISVLIITCPCALGLAVPVAQVVASGALLRRGILVKDGSAFERLAEVDQVFLDKTGTITLGRPVPSGLDRLTASQAGIALALAQASAHPISRALAQSLRDNGTMPAKMVAIDEVPGVGMTGSVGGVAATLGRFASVDGAMGVQLSIADQPSVLLPMEDAVRPDAAAAIAAFAALNLPVTIVSGDSYASVAAVARQLGLVGVAQLDPAAKLALLRRVQACGSRVMMAGDGLNDGPALAAAHASIAPSSASDVGQQAADVVFMGDSLLAIPQSIAVARATQRIVRQNFILAIGYNLLAVPLAMAGLVTPLIAAVAMSLSSIIVVANALRLSGAAR